MIMPTQDEGLKERMELTLDNLFDIFRVSNPSKLKAAVIRELRGDLEQIGYHRECKIT